MTWRGRVSLSLLPLVGALLVGVPTASAFHHGVPISETPVRTATDAEFWEIVDNPNTAPPPGTSTGADTVAEGRRKARRFPALKTVGHIAVIGGAFELGWKIGGVVAATDWFQRTLFGSIQTTATITGIEWVHATDNGSLLVAGSQGFPGGNTTITSDATLRANAHNHWVAHFNTNCSGFNSRYLVTIGTSWDHFDCKDEAAEAIRDKAAELALHSGVSYMAEPTRTSSDEYGTCCDVPNTATYILVRTETAMEKAGTVTTSRPWVAGDPVTNTTTYVKPSVTPTDREAYEATLGTEGQPQSDDQKAAEDWTIEQLDPTWEPPPPTYAIPKPQPNETATAYRTRLQTLGHLGTITLVEGAPLEGYGPLAVTRVFLPTAPGATTTRVLDPLVWPSPAPVVDKDDPLTLRHNPSTSEPAPDPSAGGGSSDGWCNCPSNTTNFEPLTDVGCSETFPCGIFAMAAGIIGAFNVTPDAPTWTFDLSNAHLSEGDFSIDLQAFDPYMSLIRTLISWVLWIGAVWWLGTRLLGFKAGGDPQEAADEALP
jgi:hypothetical protein